MNILWFSWKDEGHPQAGGAESVSGHLRQQLVKDGHKVQLITSAYKGSLERETIDGIEIHRKGGRFGVYWQAFRFFKKNLSVWPDLIIDEMNTIPFGCAFYTKKRTVMLTYQLARQVWFYQMVFPFSLIGYLIEPLYLIVLSKKYKQVLTESESTRKDLARFGFLPERTAVFRVGSSLKPLRALETKKDLTQILSLGAVRPMKRTLHAVKGFEAARDSNPELRLVIAGDISGKYARKVIDYVAKSRHSKSITVLGRVSTEKRLQLMKGSAVILVTSIKEGWGLIITEAASQGTPAVAYDTDGLRDSIQKDKTGILVPPGDYQALGAAVNTLLADKSAYYSMRTAAWEFSKQFTFDNSYKDFSESILKNRLDRK